MAHRKGNTFVFGTSAPPEFSNSEEEEVWNELNYVLHLRRPRFFGRIVETDGHGTAIPRDQPADTSTGIVLDLTETLCVCELTWIDSPDVDDLQSVTEDLVQAYIRWLEWDHQREEDDEDFDEDLWQGEQTH